jgi:hypothetical protein
LGTYRQCYPENPRKSQNDAENQGVTTIKRIVPLPMYQLDVQSIGKSENIPQDFINLAENRLVKFDEKNKITRDKQAFAILKTVGAKLWEKHRKRIMAEQKAEDEEDNRREIEAEKMLKDFHSGT